MTTPETLPDEIEALKAVLVAERAAHRLTEAWAFGAKAIGAHLKLAIAKLKRERFGASSEHGRTCSTSSSCSSRTSKPAWPRTRAWRWRPCRTGRRRELHARSSGPRAAARASDARVCGGAGALRVPGQRAAAMFTLIQTAKLNDVDPEAWLADVLRRIADHSTSRLDELLPWHRKPTREQQAAA